MHNWALDGKPYVKQLRFPPLTLTRIGEESAQKEHQGVRPSAPSLLHVTNKQQRPQLCETLVKVCRSFFARHCQGDPPRQKRSAATARILRRKNILPGAHL